MTFDDDASLYVEPYLDPSGRRTIHLVLLLRDADTGTITPAETDTVVDIHDPEGADPSVVAALLDSSVTLHMPEDISAVALAALSRLPVPALFRASFWLRRHRPLILDGGRVRIADVVLEHTDEFGLLVHEPHTAPIQVQEKQPYLRTRSTESPRHVDGCGHSPDP